MKKHAQYLNYVLRHKWFVLVAGLKVGAPLWRLLIHDWSKFLPSEWTPYVQYFYGNLIGPEDEARIVRAVGFCPALVPKRHAKARFDVAWNHHQKRNKHHWQYWVLSRDDGTSQCLPIPRGYMLEMVADWMGAGRAITGRWEVVGWYTKNREKIRLEETTRKMVEGLLRRYGNPST